MSAQIPPADLRSRVLAAVAAERVPPRTAAWRRNVVVFAAGFVPSLALSVYVGGPSVGDRPIGYAVTLAVAWVAVAIVATFASLSRGASMLGRPSSWRLAVVGFTPLALLATAMVAMLSWPVVAVDDAVALDHGVCIVATFLCAMGPLASLAVLAQRSDPVFPRVTGAAFGAASGAWGAVFIELHCAHASAGHVVLGHILPVALATLVGVMVGGKVLAVRAKA